jgi:protease-4
MSMDADAIVDRRRLRRKLTTWRVLAFLLAVIAVVGGVYALYGRDLDVAGRPGAFIARIKISGLIRGDS